jgi:predicted xylose isomerase-like sugar epimerase
MRREERMEYLYKAWQEGTNEFCEALWDLQDGYGIAGYVPPQGYDWSGIRDSSDAAVEAMYNEAIQWC